VVLRVAEGDKADVDKAVKAARNAFDHGPWWVCSGIQRITHVFQVTSLDVAESDEVVKAACHMVDHGPWWGSQELYFLTVCLVSYPGCG
jgi:acyl-CoA reductase-like NAD-dependent aldehyde dehydrogenase